MYTPAQATTLISELIDEVWEAEDPEKEFAYNTIYKVDDMTRGEYSNYRIAGLDRPQERELLEDLAQVNYKEGEVQTITPISYGAQFAVPMELIKDVADIGPMGGSNAARLLSYGEFVKRMKYTFFWRIDTECALKLLNSTSTTAKYVGRDGKALASATQTGLDNPPTTQSNVTTGASFTANNVMTAISAIRTQKDDRGGWLQKPTKFRVVTSEQNAWRATEIFDTEKQVDTNNNTKNPLYKMRNQIEHVVWNELGATYTGWFVTSDRASLRMKWRDRPEFDRDADKSARAAKYFAAMRAATFHEDWRGTAMFPTS